MNRQLPNYPKVGSADRFDEIVAQGTSIRRRRRILGATGTGVSVAACLAIVLTFAGTPEPKRQSITANQPDAPATTAVEPTTPAPDNSASPEFMTVTQGDRKVLITMDDPNASSVESEHETSFASQQCVTVTLSTMSEAPVAEQHSCRTFASATASPEDGAEVKRVQFELAATDGVSVGCAAVEERLPDPVAVEHVRARTEFVAQVPDLVDAGTYKIKVVGVSGFGDGCADKTASSDPDGGSQMENTVVAMQTITIN